MDLREREGLAIGPVPKLLNSDVRISIHTTLCCQVHRCKYFSGLWKTFVGRRMIVVGKLFLHGLTVAVVFQDSLSTTHVRYASFCPSALPEQATRFKKGVHRARAPVCLCSRTCGWPLSGSSLSARIRSLVLPAVR